MHTIKSWRALFVREYLEHRIAFLWFPLGIVALLAISVISALGLHRIRVDSFLLPEALKVYEIGYLVLLALWMAYLAVALFFYFGDAFSADRRNNAMFFWKSMPVSDLKILASKYFSGSFVFPAVILVIAMVTGLMFYLAVNVAAYVLPGFALLNPLTALTSFVQISLFAVVYYVLALLWFAPFFAWVGGLSTVFGRWSLPLAFVIPGLLAVIENISMFGAGPTGGYLLNYLGYRFDFGFDDSEYQLLVLNSLPFEAGMFLNRLLAHIDWLQMGIGLVFAAVIVWLASEYRRRRIT
jgi:ABC-2 type transport system permease protein